MDPQELVNHTQTSDNEYLMSLLAADNDNHYDVEPDHENHVDADHTFGLSGNMGNLRQAEKLCLHSILF